MTGIKTLAAVLVAIGCNGAFAYGIECPDVGTLTPKGDALEIAYSVDMGISYDMASLVSMGSEDSVYVADAWGASIAIPNTLLKGQVQSAEVSFSLPETAVMVKTCNRTGN